MAKTYFLSCRDAGLDCDFEVRGVSVDEVVERCAQHGITQHNMKGFGPELYTKLRTSLRVEEDSPAGPANPNPG